MLEIAIRNLLTVNNIQGKWFLVEIASQLKIL